MSIWIDSVMRANIFEPLVMVMPLSVTNYFENNFLNNTFPPVMLRLRLMKEQVENAMEP